MASFLNKATRAWVYAGITKRGSIKVGSSATPESRCKHLRLRLAWSLEVVPASAKLVEQTARRLLGYNDDSEMFVELSDTIKAITTAAEYVSKSVHTDPLITADEARIKRVGATVH